ncbi:MAG: hypothetical protein E7358_03105 [Clostridiales bacterium]|nr:hypothetical protein [Clostridiales bacterium]
MNKSLSVHFIGVSGAGMAPLCKYILKMGFSVSGSDVVKSNYVESLIKCGLKFYYGHEHNAVEFSDIIIYSSAISNDNKELILARSLCKVIISRAELLGMILSVHKRSIGISGSHGKTTSCSMLNNVLIKGGVNANCFIGGEDKINNNENSFFGKKVAICEACEFNKNIAYLSPNVAVCLNVDNDHLDCYETIENLSREFYAFLSRAKRRFVNVDDCVLRRIKLKNCITFGIDEKCDYRAVNLKNNNGFYSFDLERKGEVLFNVSLKITGRVNVYNALSVIAICKEVFNLENSVIIDGVSNYLGVRRRFDNIGNLYGKTVICDYAHHPTEIKNLIETVKSIYINDYLLVFEPHTYSRTKLLFNSFVSVLENENVILYKEFPSRESYDYKGSSKALHNALKNSEYVEEFSSLLDKIKQSDKSNIIIIGAGELYNKVLGEIKNGNK